MAQELNNILQQYGIKVSLSDCDDYFINHMKMTGNAAKALACRAATIDPGKAYIYGVMHDVGKFFLNKEEVYKHPIVGYEMLKDKYQDIANVCLAHSFVCKDNFQYILFYCQNDIKEAKKISDALADVQITDYIKLIQFCDKISIGNTYITLEQKFQLYAQNRNFADSMIILNKYYELKKYFDYLVCEDVYSIFDIV